MDGMKIIVTGGASGIGRSVAELGLREGAEVIACDLDAHGLTRLEQEAASDNLHTYKLDTSSYSEVERFFQYIEEYHPEVNGLVNNAGIYLGQALLDYSPQQIDRVLDVNVKGYIYLSQFFGRLLLARQRHGSIVNLSSVSGQEGSSDAVYGLSKAAVLGLTKSCAMNYAPLIRVNAVAPTMTLTPMMDNIPDWRKQEYIAHQLTAEPLEAADIAETVMFLLSRKAKLYTGATLDINGGVYLR